MLNPSIRPYEQLLIYRLRLGKSQSAFALELGIDYTLYRRIEKGLARPYPAFFDVCKNVTPLPREQAIIARRRAGMTQGAVAAEMGVTRGWLVQQEKGTGNSDSLISYWQNRLSM